MKYKLYTYDLWGNEEDGFIINDYYAHSDTFEIDENMTDEQIIELLEFVNPNSIMINEIGFPENIYFLLARNQKPLCELRLIQE